MHINSDKLHLQVNSEVTTLNMYDCHGNSLEDLQPDDPLSIQLPRKPQRVGHKGIGITSHRFWVHLIGSDIKAQE